MEVLEKRKGFAVLSSKGGNKDKWNKFMIPLSC